MGVVKIEMKKGEHPSKWKQVKFADIDSEEPFVKQMLEIVPFVDAGRIEGEEREKAKHALLALLTEGLMPPFSVLEKIRASVRQPLPMMDQMELYRGFYGKLWRGYKQLLQPAVRSLGFEIGFLFQENKTFEEGVKKFRNSHPLLAEKLRPQYEEFLSDNRNTWQAKIKEFRNDGLEHPKGDQNRFAEFYTPTIAEQAFNCVWKTIIDILVPLLEVHLPFGTTLVEQNPVDPGPRWPNRFRYQLPPQYKLE
jgi:hypothetical protein